MLWWGQNSLVPRSMLHVHTPACTWSMLHVHTPVCTWSMLHIHTPVCTWSMLHVHTPVCTWSMLHVHTPVCTWSMLHIHTPVCTWSMLHVHTPVCTWSIRLWQDQTQANKNLKKIWSQISYTLTTVTLYIWVWLPPKYIYMHFYNWPISNLSYNDTLKHRTLVFSCTMSRIIMSYKIPIIVPFVLK